MMEHVTSLKGLSFDFDETALFPYGYSGAKFMPLLNPANGVLVGFLLNSECSINFTYNDLYKLFLVAKRSGVKVSASDEKGILDETYEEEETLENDGYTFCWLPSFLKTAAATHTLEQEAIKGAPPQKSSGPQMETLTCAKCGMVYRLGVDSFLMSHRQGVASLRASGVRTFDGAGPVSSTYTVGELYTLPPEGQSNLKAKTADAIAEAAEGLRRGGALMWRCRKCDYEENTFGQEPAQP